MEHHINDKNSVIRVLLVEDSSFDVELINSVLSLTPNKKFLVVNVGTLSNAKEILDEQVFDIMLLDLFLPDSDGIDTIKNARKMAMDMPIVILSSTKDEDVAICAVKEGAQDFLVKGQTKLANLPRVISYALERAHIEKELKQAKKEAEEATILKDKFVSLVAHDLKSPFTAILGLLSIVYEDENEPLCANHKKRIGQVLEAAKRQVNMIDELLKLSRLQTGKIILEKRFFDGYIVASSAVSNVRRLAENKGISVVNKVAHGTRLFADLNLYNEVLLNLVSNSVKFCNKGDTITVSNQPDDRTTIVVKDTGVGVCEKILSKLFKHDEKTSTVGTSGEKGTGLGLPFCNELITLHGGSIKVESAANEGAVFFVHLPYVVPKILVVDDEAGTVDIIMSALKELDVECFSAKNGEVALEFLEQNIVHLILLDLIMPKIDGFELLERIRNNPETKDVPVIVFTANKIVDTRDRVFQMGANDFVTKPFQKEELLPRVKRFVA